MSSNTQQPEKPPAGEREDDELAPSDLEGVHGGTGQLLPAVQGLLPAVQGARKATTLDGGSEIAIEKLTITHEAIEP
jgi:hypothetical protein